MTTFDLTFSFTDMFDTFSVYPYDYSTQEEEFESKLKKDFYKIKIILICLLFLIISLTIICMLKNYKLLLQNFENKKILYLPKSTFFFSQIIIASMYFYKNIMKTTDNMFKYIVERTKNKNQGIKSDNNNSNNIWQDISDRCQSNFDKVFKDIISDFEDDEININYNSPLSKYLHIKDEDLENTMTKFNEKYGLDIIYWGKTNDLLSNVFSEKYTEFKSIESKLLEIKLKTTELNDWSKSTESLLKNLEEKDNSDIKEIINNYVKSKLDNLDFPNLISKYQELYLELRALVKFFRKNPDIELLSRCQICLTNLKNSIIVPCGHTACKDCLDYQQKLDKKIICPVCRQEGTSIAKIFN